MAPSPNRILITGGFGFLGAHLAKALVDDGFEVTLFDNADWTTSAACQMNLGNRKGVTEVYGSVLNLSDLSVLKEDFNYIAHAAGILGIRKVTEIPILTMDVNITGTRHMLDFARKQKQFKRFLFFSTSEIYGQHASEPLENSASVIPTVGSRWCYATSKLAGEYFVKSFAEEHGLPFSIVRPFNVYGPFRTGSNAMTDLVQRALDGQPITISGTGNQTRSWCHINDFVKGVVACLTQEKAAGEAFNIGNDETHISILELSSMICKLLKSPSEIIVSGKLEDDVETRLANIDKARLMLSFEPTIGLEAGIKDVAEWLTQCQALR